MESKRLEVKAEGKKVYDIVIEDSFENLAQEMETLEVSERKICIVVDRMVAGYYLDSVREVLNPICKRVCVFLFQEGEENKNLQTVSTLYQFLIRNKFDRKDMLVALGGGVTGDLTGFAAATYLRGIDFVQIPTSLLSQVDSSIGGKTGVDFNDYKNMVGAFYMPKLVYINVKTIKTLDDRQFKSGMGEVIKHGLIRDKSYYEWMTEKKAAIKAREDEVMAKLIETSCKIKREVVEEDPKEHGIRAYLNFGHTLGHAIEKEMNFTLTHGECVGIGSVLAAKMSAQRGYINRKEYNDILALYQYFDFGTVPEELSPETILNSTKYDKKMEHGSIKFILLEEVGKAAIYKDVSDKEMLEVLS